MTKRNRLGFLLGGAVLLLVPGLTPAEDQALHVPQKVRANYGDRAIAILLGASKVDAFRLGVQEKGKPRLPVIGSDDLHFFVTATGKGGGQELAAPLRVFLLDERRQDAGAGCFDPGVAFRFRKGHESVTMLACFKSLTFLLVTRDADGKQVNLARDGFSDREFAFFHRLKQLALEAFPNDQQLQALKPPSEKDL
jgi:hypothetical protein